MLLSERRFVDSRRIVCRVQSASRLITAALAETPGTLHYRRLFEAQMRRAAEEVGGEPLPRFSQLLASCEIPLPPPHLHPRPRRITSRTRSSLNGRNALHPHVRA